MDIASAKRAALKVLTSSTGPVAELEKKWLYSFTTPYIGPIPDMYKEFYRLKGFTTGSLNDRAKKYLNGQGYTGPLTEMWWAYWNDGGEAPTP
jgi:hypothetical protein